MGMGISKSVGAHELEPASLGELIHQHVRAAIETAGHEELRAVLGTTPYERSEVRCGYRNGTKARTLTGPTGSRAHPAASHAVRWHEGMDVGDRPPLSAANAQGQ